MSLVFDGDFMSERRRKNTFNLNAWAVHFLLNVRRDLKYLARKMGAYAFTLLPSEPRWYSILGHRALDIVELSKTVRVYIGVVYEFQSLLLQRCGELDSVEISFHKQVCQALQRIGSILDTVVPKIQDVEMPDGCCYHFTTDAPVFTLACTNPREIA